LHVWPCRPDADVAVFVDKHALGFPVGDGGVSGGGGADANHEAVGETLDFCGGGGDNSFPTRVIVGVEADRTITMKLKRGIIDGGVGGRFR